MNAIPKVTSDGVTASSTKTPVKRDAKPSRRAAFDGHDELQAQRKKEIEHLYGAQSSL